MPFSIQTISEHGTSNPIVARLILQTSELIENTGFNTETREAILETAMETGQRILTCWGTWSWIGEQQAECDSKSILVQDGGAVEIPSVSLRRKF